MNKEIQLPELTVCSLQKAKELLENKKHNYRNLISIGDYHSSYGINTYNNFTNNKIRLQFDDIVLTNYYFSPKIEDVEALINFCSDIKGKTIIHCMAGISRSPAAGIILYAVLCGKNNEYFAIEKFMQQVNNNPNILPNELMIYVADKLLQRDGKLLNAYKLQFLLK